MISGRRDELWARFVAGGQLTEHEERELTQAMKEDPEFAGTLVDDMELDGILWTLPEEEGSGEAAARAFLDAVHAEREAARFVRSVEMRLQEELPPSPAKTRRPSRRSTPRWWPGAREPGSRKGLFPMAVAAGLILVWVLLLSHSTSTPPSREERKPEVGRGLRAPGTKTEEAAPAPPPGWLTQEARAQAERERREAEERLSRLREEEKRAEEARASAQAKGDQDYRKKVEDTFLEALGRRKAEEEKLARLLREEERARESARPERPPPPGRMPSDRPSTTAVVAHLERMEGEVRLLGPADKVPASAGEALLAGGGLETGAEKSAAFLVFPDRTRIEMGPGTEVGEIRAEGGKRIFVGRGEIRAFVARQAKDQPMVFSTPHGEAVVLGTTLRILVDPDPKKGTRLEVEEGRVRFSNLEKKSVEVSAGHFAFAAPGVDLVARSWDPSTAVPRRGLALWLRADQGITQSGGTVLVWADRSGNNRHAVQRRSVQQPAFVPSAVHGLPALRFDGVDDCLSFPCPVTGLGGMTIFLAASAFEERTGGTFRAGHAALYWRELEDHGTVLVAPYPQTVRFGFGTGQPFAAIGYTRPEPVGRQYSVTTALKNGAEQLLLVNGRECHRLSDRRPQIGKCEEVGQIGRGEGDTYFPGEISEILVYARALAPGERQAVEQYLMGKYLPK